MGYVFSLLGVVVILKFLFENRKPRDAWLAQLVEHETLLDPRIVGLSSTLGVEIAKI